MIEFLLALFGSMYYGSKLISDHNNARAYDRKMEDYGIRMSSFIDKYSIGYYEITLGMNNKYAEHVAKEYFNMTMVELYNRVGRIVFSNIVYSKDGKLNTRFIQNGIEFYLNNKERNDILIKSAKIIEENLNNAGVDAKFVFVNRGDGKLYIDKVSPEPGVRLW